MHYGDPVSFLEVTEDWREAIKWMKKLAENDPEKAKCVVIKVMKTDRSSEPLKQKLMEFTAKDFNVEEEFEAAVRGIRVLESNLEMAKSIKALVERRKTEFSALKKQLAELDLVLD